MIDRAANAAALLGGVVTLVITLLISFDVLMRYFFDAPQLFVDDLLLLFRLAHLFAQRLALFNQLGPIIGGCFWNLRRDFFLLTSQIIAFCDESVSFVTQTNHSVNVRCNSALEAIVDDCVTIFADELQVQHWMNS